MKRLCLDRILKRVVCIFFRNTELPNTIIYTLNILRAYLIALELSRVHIFFIFCRSLKPKGQVCIHQQHLAGHKS